MLFLLGPTRNLVPKFPVGHSSWLCLAGFLVLFCKGLFGNMFGFWKANPLDDFFDHSNHPNLPHRRKRLGWIRPPENSRTSCSQPRNAWFSMDAQRRAGWVMLATTPKWLVNDKNRPSNGFVYVQTLKLCLLDHSQLRIVGPIRSLLTASLKKLAVNQNLRYVYACLGMVTTYCVVIFRG